MPALATTDHGYLFGAFDFWQQATDKGIKPIIGVEAYVTPGTARGDKTRVRWGEESQRKDDISGGGSYTHMTLLSYNNVGMRNLFRASSIASLDSVFGKWPRLDRELLNTYSEGLIATTGCPSGEVQTRLRLGQYREAVEAAAEFRDIFGAENYFCELMDHGLDIERRVTGDLLRLAKDLNLPLVATNDLHYTHEHDAKAHEALLAIQSGSTLLEPTLRQRRFPLRVLRQRLLPEVAAGNARAVPRPPGSLRQHPADRRALRSLVQHRRQLHAAVPLPAGRGRNLLAGQGSGHRPALPLPQRHPGQGPQAGRLRAWRHHLDGVPRATSWWWPTSSTGPRTMASGWVPAVVPVPAPWWPTPCASPTSTRCSTA